MAAAHAQAAAPSPRAQICLEAMDDMMPQQLCRLIVSERSKQHFDTSWQLAERLLLDDSYE